MASGIIVIDKPAGWTSMDVCAKLRRVFGERRVGHSGTLDPMATGVLPVFVGRATRAVEFADKSDKEYIAGLKLGVVTNTQDTSGEVLERHDLGGVGRQDVDRVLEQFWGDILQIPPMYSAIKIQGKRLYELARKGCEVERPPRPVTIHSLELEEREEREELASPADFLLRVRCSKGTYIRTLCHDIGQALGCGGCMSSLRRTMAAGFTLKDAVPLEEVLAAEEPQRLLMPVDAYFRDRPALTVPLSGEKPLRNGAKIPMPGLAPGEYRVYAQSGEFLALGREETGQLATVKSFFEV